MKKKQLTIAYHNTFNSPEGKIVLQDLKKRCPLLKNGVNPNSPIDTNMLLVQEGQSNLIKHIYIMLKRDPNEELPDKAVNK